MRPLAALRLVWPLLLLVAVFVAVGGVGFSPTDEGLIQAQSLRILHGQIPHVDIVSPRPLGSAYLHVVDLVLPTPLVATSRFIALCEIAAYTVLLACLAYRRGLMRWSLTQCLLVATAILVNLHTFPITAWHTLDGLLLTSGGFVLVTLGLARRRPLLVDAGMISLGAALVVKQSFVVAAMIGIGWLAWDSRPLRGSSVVRVVRGAVAAAIPGLAYLVVVTVGGGLGEARLQLTDAGGELRSSVGASFERFGSDLGAGFLVAGAAIVALGVIAWRRTSSRPASARALDVLDVGSRALVTVGIVTVVVGDRFEILGTWGIELLVLLLGLVVMRLLAEHTVDWVALLTASIGVMAMLSWGYAVPDLVGGSIALVIIDRVWRGAPQILRVGRARFAAIGAAAIVLVVAAVVLRDERTTNIYRHLPGEEPTVSLADIDDDFAGITSNASIFRYLRQARDCVRRYPASRVAVLPDNAILAPVLGLDNPFPSDWMYSPELVGGATDANLAAARRLARDGDYLVLFETVPAVYAGYIDVPTHVEPETPYWFYFDPLGAQIHDALLTGPAEVEAISCGSFVGLYSSPRGVADRHA